MIVRKLEKQFTETYTDNTSRLHKYKYCVMSRVKCNLSVMYFFLFYFLLFLFQVIVCHAYLSIHVSKCCSHQVIFSCCLFASSPSDFEFILFCTVRCSHRGSADTLFYKDSYVELSLSELCIRGQSVYWP